MVSITNLETLYCKKNELAEFIILKESNETAPGFIKIVLVV